jgi:hypothetical protein
MNGSAEEREDLVSAWFGGGEVPPPALTRETFFEFAPGILAVRSNSDAFIEMIADRLRHYSRTRAEADSTGKAVIEADIYFLDDPVVKDGIFLPSSWGGVPLDLKAPARFRVFETDSFYHLKLDRREGFWRPNDLLVSFSTGDHKSIKLLITDAPAAHFAGGKTLRKKGPVNWEEIADMVHMLFMRLFDVFCLHAASLIFKDKGVIMTGTSGSGKTTTALALIENGAVLLSDELTLVSTGGGEDTVISGIVLDPRLTHIDEEKLYALGDPATKKNNWEKISYPLPKKTVGPGLHKQVKPALILFMDLKENNPSHHVVHKMDEQEAVTWLISQVLDPSNSTRHREIFDAVFKLVTGCSLYRLEPGRDIDSLPEFIAGLL